MIANIKNDSNKSWKKINEERKALRKQSKQEKLLKAFEQQQKINADKSATNQLKNETNVDEKETKPNPSTISIAVPGSILENAQSIELRTYVAGQIARAACIFRVNEVIVFDDVGIDTPGKMKIDYNSNNENGVEANSTQTIRSSCLQMARILQYLECPQYLRKFFFPLHKDLKYSGLLNPLDAPHHLRQQNVFRYREGIVTEKPAKAGQCYVNVGLLNEVLVNKSVKAGLRVTVKLNNPEDTFKKQRGCIVSPDEPRRETGVYWGYTVRIAHGLSDIFTKCPYAGGYDVTMGTSDHGKNIHELPTRTIKYNHMLLVFGGLQGLEAALTNDDKLQVDEPELLFDHYLNVLPKQGSRTIRTEEALLIALAAVQEKINAKIPDIEGVEFIKDSLPRSTDTKKTIIPKPGETKAKVKALKRKLNEKKYNEEKTQQSSQIIKQNHHNVAKAELKEQKATKTIINPFKPKPVTNEPISIDFEIVPATQTKSSKKPYLNNKMNDEDLSRFD